MKRVLIALIFALISLWAVATTPTYVNMTYNVRTPGGDYPASLTATATITYDAYHNPSHRLTPVLGTYVDGIVTWTLPVGCYVRVICTDYKLDSTVVIPAVGTEITELVPVVDPPAPTWSQLLWSCTQQPECDIVTDYDVDCVDGRFSGNVTANSLTAHGTGTGTLNSYGALDMTIPWSYYSTLHNHGISMVPDSSSTYAPEMATRTSSSWSSPGDTYARWGASKASGSYFQVRDLAVGSTPYYWGLSKTDGTMAVAKLGFYTSVDPGTFGFTIGDTFTYDSGHGNLTWSGNLYADNLSGTNTGDQDLSSLTPRATSTTSGHLPSFSDSNGSLQDSGVVASAVLTAEVDPRLPAYGTTGNILQSSGSAWASVADPDGVVGNEVTDTTDTTLTRSGSGTSGAPYTLGLNLGNANTWTANQTMPYLISSTTYNPDAPVAATFPSGWPNNGQAADEDNLEFNTASNPMTDTADIDSSTTVLPGYLTVTTNGLAKQGIAYMTLPVSTGTGLIDCRAKVSVNTYANGSSVCLVFLYNNSGSMDGWYVSLKGVSGYWQRGWGTVTNYVLAAPTLTTIYDDKKYIGFYRLANGDLYYTDSNDGITYGSYARLATGVNKDFTVIGVGADLSANTIPENSFVAVDWIRFK